MGSISIAKEQLELGKPAFPVEATTLEYAQSLDAKDHLRSFREKFIIPSKLNTKTKKLAKPDESKSHEEKCIYFCGNSLGLQPRAAAEYLQAYLTTWATIGVHGHFRELEDSPLTQWQLLAEHASKQQAPIVGALANEVATMGSLTVNLHLLMASFYTPTSSKNKIILDWKAFPSDHYAIESQIRGHGYDPAESMIMIGPEDGEYEVSTEKILSVIDKHASSTSLILLPGIQYYTGQFFDIKTITKYAQSKGLVVGWDLAHAAGNVPLQLHDWNVDFAAWCTYKYMNAGPGAIAGAFVHERHGTVEYIEGQDKPIFRHRLSGWYGGDQVGRFNMDNKFRPSPGASGYQISNPSVIDLTSLCASLSVFNQTSMSDIRRKSVTLTAYLEYLLLSGTDSTTRAFRITTPSNPQARGTQLSILLKPGRMDVLMGMLEDAGIVVDKRKPDVIRVAPVPLYNTYEEVWQFVQIFSLALAKFE
ncbi:putative Kynureninase [Venustampulla echinocandica]|uniref:Kynureninase n=1 Tax=Venustampulla echinocandica TaxID=2656787 RepID=A0A370TLG8_9HELO|nr:putative Kynureninase [Venustampulla echinocandica]RDL36370.1 putative Kynureninase [Venustampulla echinocandica]